MNPFIGEVKLLPWNWAPKGWAFCDGRLLPIQQNTALFSLLGTQYGGNGTTNFALPDLRGRTPEHYSNSLPQGAAVGVETVGLTLTTMPAHTHGFSATSATASANSAANAIIGTDPSGPIDFLAAGPAAPFTITPTSIGITGNGIPHENMQPYLVMNYCIALVGIFPSRN
ncbi:phage tail protein [Sphingomonas sp. 28-63-12]|uniref:phage tail protein n=1 Tax=Sphingomonas sp. 28-63-12 TaxID=1970434 RepID=UPI000BCB4213|nr:MAG: hypothetical protein B7Y47_06055 [Sphingomonas sp. 28-63-12]